MKIMEIEVYVTEQYFTVIDVTTISDTISNTGNESWL